MWEYLEVSWTSFSSSSRDFSEGGEGGEAVDGGGATVTRSRADTWNEVDEEDFCGGRWKCEKEEVFESRDRKSVV